MYSIDEFKGLFYGIAAEMDQYNGFDPTGQNCVLPCFQSYDPDILIRYNPETWTTTGTKANSLPAIPATLPAGIIASDRHKEAVIKMINTGFDNIIDVGHPALRSLCISIGGYVISGYIDLYEAQQLINYRIETHPYLKKGVRNYQLTAAWSLSQGMNKPLLLSF